MSADHHQTRAHDAATPALSVVMPVHNALPHLDAAVRSILQQSFRDFEFVILDDASTDGSSERLQYWAGRDGRIRLHRAETNLGPARSSNRVVELAGGALIARMDADDVSHPDRLRRQLALLESRPEVGLVGTVYETLDVGGSVLRGPSRWRLKRPSWFVPFPHGSICFRRELFDRIGGYREECVFWEDQDFFLRLSAATQIAVLPEPLYQHRHSQVSTRLASDPERVERAVDLMYRCVDRLRAGRSYDDLLREPPTAAKVDPRVFVSLGSLLLWAGLRPRFVRTLLRRARMRPDWATVSSFGWSLWATLSPATLRLFLRSLAGVRNLATGRLDGPVPWQRRRRLPGAPAVPKNQSRPIISPASAKR
jgi:glycosyltransferase involved in cell wall biosynthesis